MNDLNRLNVLNGFPDLSIRDHLAESAAELADRPLMHEIRVIVERCRLAIDDRQECAVAFRHDRERRRGLNLQRRTHDDEDFRLLGGVVKGIVLLM